jgi:ankyrin repeat protein
MAERIVRSDVFQWSDVSATGNARQHIGHAYHSTTHNYGTSTPHISISVKPPEHIIHKDLMRACHQGQGPRRLDLLLGRGADIDHRDELQRTPLHRAAASGSLPTVSHLLDSGADLHACAQRIGTPLHSAVLSGSITLVRYLVDAGAEVSAFDELIGTPLHCAAFLGVVEMVRFLVEHGAEINRCSGWVGIPLSIAATKGRMGAIEVLLEHGADVNEACGYFGSAAHMACAAGNVGVLRRLHRAGARYDERQRTCYAIYRDVLESVDLSFPDSIDSRTLAGETVISGCPVILAIDHGNVEAVEFCMDLNLDEHTYSSYRKTEYTAHVQGRISQFSRSSINLAFSALDHDMLRLLLARGVSSDWKETMLCMRDSGSKEDSTAVRGNDLGACISLLVEHGHWEDTEFAAHPSRDEPLSKMQAMGPSEDAAS